MQRSEVLWGKPRSVTTAMSVLTSQTQPVYCGDRRTGIRLSKLRAFATSAMLGGKPDGALVSVV